jgi:3alpha(or 20beta)-hydroxysteroid dehydrogenase
MTSPGLSRKVAIVTGACGGIGAATCQRLITQGCRVVAVDIDADALDALAATLAGQVATVCADVSREEECRDYVAAAVRHFGSVDLLVNNAGVLGARHTIAEMPVEEFDRVHAVNVRGVFLGLHFVLQQMIAQATGGAIVNVSSVAAFRSHGAACAYDSAKRAVLGLSNSAAIEAGPRGIRVNAICPGPIDTPMLRQAIDRNAQGAYPHLPLGRAGTPDEVAALIVYLLGDDASYITAGTFTIDGGMMH